MKVSIFITCIVDQVFPEVGVKMVDCLTRLGVDVQFNDAQTCCGQPAYNTGYFREARDVARQTLAVLEDDLKTADYVVTPSGSCAAMIKRHFDDLFSVDEALRKRAANVARRVFEFTEFLTEVLNVEDVGAVFPGRVTYHDSCHLRRELGVADGPRKLIQSVHGIDFVEMTDAEACCGFGGTFSVKYADISRSIAEAKAAQVEQSGVEAVVACDASCLMQISGELKRRGSRIRCMHIAELLASEIN
jgi:L-lactate dehydrogenase complex protein LldE